LIGLSPEYKIDKICNLPRAQCEKAIQNHISIYWKKEFISHFRVVPRVEYSVQEKRNAYKKGMERAVS
jgi:hypothetical protein